MISDTFYKRDDMAPSNIDNFPATEFGYDIATEQSVYVLTATECRLCLKKALGCITKGELCTPI
jgi:hypothetical protein